MLSNEEPAQSEIRPERLRTCRVGGAHITGNRPAAAETTFAVSSVQLLSTTITSKSAQSMPICAARVSSVRAKLWARL